MDVSGSVYWSAWLVSGKVEGRLWLVEKSKMGWTGKKKRTGQGAQREKSREQGRARAAEKEEWQQAVVKKEKEGGKGENSVGGMKWNRAVIGMVELCVKIWGSREGLWRRMGSKGVCSPLLGSHGPLGSKSAQVQGGVVCKTWALWPSCLTISWPSRNCVSPLCLSFLVWWGNLWLLYNFRSS